ncbi:MAG: hypothetical protein ACR2PO_04315 [Methyloligellaceae bacterium]
MRSIFCLVLGLLSVGAMSAVAQAGYKEAAVSNGGTVTGKVAVGGAKAEAKSFTISKNPEVCGTGTREVPQVRASGDALMDAVVFLDKVKEGKAFPSGLKKITIDQKKCTFEPYLSVMMNEGQLEAVNSDPVLHNIHTYELIGRARRTVMNVSQPEKGNIVTKKVKLRKGAGMKVECDAHDFMHAFVFVARNPYYAVVNDKGEFEIKDVPPGEYTIKVWHGVLGEKKGKVKVSAGGKASVDFSY